MSRYTRLNIAPETNWTLADQSLAASNARIARETVDVIDAAFARGKVDADNRRIAAERRAVRQIALAAE